MTGRERLLKAINNEKPDRMPVQVHNWMPYYLKYWLGGIDQFQAYEKFGMDMVIYVAPNFIYSDGDLANWKVSTKDLGTDADGNANWEITTETPDGTLRERKAGNEITQWHTEYAFKEKTDAGLFIKYCPVPVDIDWTPVEQAKKRLGERGIIRRAPFSFGQGSPWQSFGTWMDTQHAILAAMDDPDWVHRILSSMLEKQLKALELDGWDNYDLLETGGGAGSSTVISPNMHREFCLPYDKTLHDAIHKAGSKVVYHLCGGVMPLLEMVAENGADGMETMTPVSMGGDCDLARASERVGDKLFFIGGFDQNAGFERGTPDQARQLVRQCFEDTCDKDGAYICSPSDHFFSGKPENMQAFADEAKKCFY